jgi:methionyl-tRNA formyltransferase
MKLIFAGTPAFAASALVALNDAGHEIALVLTQPDRPAGRGQKSTSSAVAQTAERLSLALEKPPSLKDAHVTEELQRVGAEAMVVAAYGLMLPPALLALPRYGCLNIHGSLLPRWRGAAPVQRAIEAGDTETGVAIMQMEAGLDTGPVLLEKKIAIAPDETAASLFEKLAALGASAIVAALAKLPTLVATPQPIEGANYARKIDKAEARIDWREPAAHIERRIRAFDPFPGCETTFDGRSGIERVKIWRANVVNNDQPNTAPGNVVHCDGKTLVVQCGQQQLEWVSVQKPGGNRITTGEFLRGNPITTRTQLS